MTEIGFAPDGPTVLHMDNTSTIRIITKPDEVTHRTKYIRIAYHWIRDCVRDERISPSYIKSADNVSDIFTKPLPADTHWRLMEQLGLHERADVS
jgi:hypothetical protein